jgi:hypothetical protein
MRYEEKILAYIDILGFKKAVGKTIEKINNNEIENICEIQKIDNLLEEERFHLNIREYLLGKPKIKGKVTCQFSDTIIISYLKESDIHHILLDIYILCAMAIEKGFLYRGAIVCGKIIHTEIKIFGPALIDAYNIESTKAIFPRILLDDNIIDIVNNNHSLYSNSDVKNDILENIISYDFDGKPFINYIDKLDTGVDNGFEGKQKHLMYIDEIIRNMDISDDSIKCKYLWLKEKYDCSFAIFKSTGVSDPP